LIVPPDWREAPASIVTVLPEPAVDGNVKSAWAGGGWDGWLVLVAVVVPGVALVVVVVGAGPMEAVPDAFTVAPPASSIATESG